MGGDYKERLRELRMMVGKTSLDGSCTVDQVYAHYQHVHLEFHHPRGGEAMYLTNPFMESYNGYLKDYAAQVLKDGGHGSMATSMEHLSDQVELRAPVEFADLRRSGHAQVKLDGKLIHDRAPKQHRLSEAELRMKARLRKLPPEILGWIWWHVMGHHEPPPRHSRWEV